MASKRSEYVLDELICFLSNPLFQVPVLSFMESNCLIFDPSSEDSASYREIHGEYKKLVDLLLEGFRTDTGLTHDQIIKSMKDLNSKSDLRDMFQVLFEQVLATDDFPIFVRIMAQKNIELQQQALMLISQMMGGSLPESLVKDLKGKDNHAAQSKAQQNSKDEDEILMAVLAKSKAEYENQKKQDSKDQEELMVIVGISKAEEARLQANMKDDTLSQQFQKSASLSEQPLPIIKTPSAAQKPSVPSASIPPPAAYTPKRPKDPPAGSKPVIAQHSLGVKSGGDSGVSSAQAAAAWLKNAESEVNTSDAHSKAVQAAAASMAGMSEKEYQQRVAFLKEQRDKLMEMKRKEREKQLLTAEHAQPQRPASARAARAALQNKGGDNVGQGDDGEDEKKLAMRRAIADRIKSELMGKK